MRFARAAGLARPFVSFARRSVAAVAVYVAAAAGAGAADGIAPAAPVTEMDARAPVAIDEIRFSGNKVTRPETMLQEMTFKPGAPATRSDIEASRQAIMNLGIFKEVRAELAPLAGRTVLTIAVVEKRYLLPLPRIDRNADGDISYGAQLRWDNAFGRNQQINATYENTQATSGNASESRGLTGNYAYPRVGGSRYGLNLSARWQRQIVDASTQGYPGEIYGLDSKFAGISVSRLLSPAGPSVGWRATMGLNWGRNIYSDLGPLLAPLYADRQRVGWQAGVGFYDVRDYLYSRAGAEYGYSLDLGVPALGSDTFYYVHDVFLRRYNLITERPHVNLDYQLRFGLASVEQGAGLGAFALGSASTIRGYPRNSLYGNAFVQANIEYKQPLFGLRELRGLVFFDAGNAYASASDIDLLDLKTSVGVGLRYNVTTFVKVQLRLDYAYAIDRGELKRYAGTNEAF